MIGSSPSKEQLGGIRDPLLLETTVFFALLLLQKQNNNIVKSKPRNGRTIVVVVKSKRRHQRNVVVVVKSKRHNRRTLAAAGPRIDMQECDGSEFASMSLAFRLSGSERDWIVDDQSENQ